MPVERAQDHPTFDNNGNAVTSLAAPARGSDETALFQVALPAGGALPRHRHDHFDVFTVIAGEGVMHLSGEEHTVAVGDAVVVPPGELHWLDTAEGVTIVVTMLPGTQLIREDDGAVIVPPWVS